MKVAPQSFSNSVPLAQSCAEDGIRPSEMYFRKSSLAASREDVEREWFVSLLWAAFPEATSENNLADLVSEVLDSEKCPCTSRTVKNWLSFNSTPHFRYVMRVIALAGAERVFQIIDREGR